MAYDLDKSKYFVGLCNEPPTQEALDSFSRRFRQSPQTYIKGPDIFEFSLRRSDHHPDLPDEETWLNLAVWGERYFTGQREIRANTRQTSSVPHNSNWALSETFARGQTHWHRKQYFEEGTVYIMSIAHPHVTNEELRREYYLKIFNACHLYATAASPMDYAWPGEDNFTAKVGVMMQLRTAATEWGASTVNRVWPPPECSTIFSEGLARCCVRLARARFTAIGALDTTERYFGIRVVAVPGLGGPWATPAAFIEAVNTKVKKVLASTDEDDERYKIIEKQHNFLEDLIPRAAAFEEGSYPLTHRGLTYDNLLVEPNGKLQAVTSWRRVMTMPWELAQFTPIFGHYQAKDLDAKAESKVFIEMLQMAEQNLPQLDPYPRDQKVSKAQEDAKRRKDAFEFAACLETATNGD